MTRKPRKRARARAWPRGGAAPTAGGEFRPALKTSCSGGSPEESGGGILASGRRRAGATEHSADGVAGWNTAAGFCSIAWNSKIKSRRGRSPDLRSGLRGFGPQQQAQVVADVARLHQLQFQPLRHLPGRTSGEQRAERKSAVWGKGRG